MAFNMDFNADEAFLLFVAETLQSNSDARPRDDAALVRGAVCVLALDAAIEASASILIKPLNVENWDRLRTKEKVDEIARSQGTTIDWGGAPWQTLTKLRRVRNWLAHFKEPYIGLFGAHGYWQGGEPKFDPNKVLGFPAVQGYFDASVQAVAMLRTIMGLPAEAERLTGGDFSPFLIG